MRVYFLSCRPAALKLDGDYLGKADMFERYVDLPDGGRAFAEIIPEGDFLPENFFIDENLLKQPPENIDIYIMESDLLVYARAFSARDASFKPLFKRRFCGNLVTLFRQGGIFLSVEGSEYGITPIYAELGEITAEEQTLAGFPVLALRSGRSLLIISHTGELVFHNEVSEATFGDTLAVKIPFSTCTAAYVECRFSYDGIKLEQIDGRTVETRAPEPDILHFAFFESVLTRGDYARYLSDALRPKSALLREYLGDFTGVSLPTGKFAAEHPNLTAVGLVYPQKRNIYRIKYFAVEISEGKIDNIFPV